MAHRSVPAPFFTGAPFALTADREGSACWAGRRAVKSKLERLCRSYSTRRDSSLDLIWANLGSGKSHALFHLMRLLASANNPCATVTAYVEMPLQPRRFIDLYQQIMAGLQLDTVSSKLLAGDVSILSEDLRKATRSMVYGGSDEQAIAREWLTAGRPLLRDLRNATGISGRIEDDSHASDILAQVVAGLATSELRTVILVDEFQRVAASTQKQRDAVLQSVRSVFSRNPAYLSIVLAVTSRIEKTALDIIPKELRTLMGMRPTVSLPEMTEEEAMEFLLERFCFFRPIGYAGTAAAPFGLEALRMIVSHVAKTDRERLIPRTLLQAAAWVYDEAIQMGVAEMSPLATESLLRELQWDV
jgi:hypothetical protein